MRFLTALSLTGLCLLMGALGVSHFADPAPYRRIMPTPLRKYDAALVALSGAVELLCALLLAIPRTRHVGALVTAMLLAAVFPSNVQMALDCGRGRL